jgi:lipopolysaccharide assembly protein A
VIICMEGFGLMSTHPEHSQEPTAHRHPQHVIKRTRTGGVWVASVLFALVLVLLLIFILENGQRASISYFGAHGHFPLGVALLFAAVLGILMVVIPGTARIVQLRMAARRHRNVDATADSRAAPAPSGPARTDLRPDAEPADPSMTNNPSAGADHVRRRP